MSEVKNVLNYWVLNNSFKCWKGEFLGFIDIVEGTDAGLKLNEETFIACLSLFYNETGWGDEMPTSPELPWVLYLRGIDDSNYYMLFENKEDAVAVAKEYLIGNKKLNPFVHTYKERSWQWQN